MDLRCAARIRRGRHGHRRRRGLEVPVAASLRNSPAEAPWMIIAYGEIVAVGVRCRGRTGVTPARRRRGRINGRAARSGPTWIHRIVGPARTAVGVDVSSTGSAAFKDHQQIPLLDISGLHKPEVRAVISIAQARSARPAPGAEIRSTTPPSWGVVSVARSSAPAAAALDRECHPPSGPSTRPARRPTPRAMSWSSRPSSVLARGHDGLVQDPTRGDRAAHRPTPPAGRRRSGSTEQQHGGFPEEVELSGRRTKGMPPARH